MSRPAVNIAVYLGILSSKYFLLTQLHNAYITVDRTGQWAQLKQEKKLSKHNTIS